MATSPPDELTALIERVRVAAFQQDACEKIRLLLRDQVRGRIRDIVDGESEDESQPAAALSRQVERKFWRRLWAKRNELPHDPAVFAEELVGRALIIAQDVADEYQRLQGLLAKCRPDIRGCLIQGLGRKLAFRAAALESQVLERLWDLRHELTGDCRAFNRVAGETAEEIGRLSALFSEAANGDKQAIEEVFTKFRDYMLESCRRIYPGMREDQREDVIHAALLSMLKSVSRGLDPERTSTWRAFLRTVVFRAGKAWKRQNDRYVQPPKPRGGAEWLISTTGFRQRSNRQSRNTPNCSG